METVFFHAPTIEYSLVDALNRRAAATGSPAYASSAAGADYNGHRISVWFNDYRNYYIAEYQWAGRCVVARGSADICIAAAMKYYQRGVKGSSVTIALEPEHEEAVAHARTVDGLVEGREGTPSWMTWRHSTAARCARDSACRSMVMVFDLSLLEAAESERDYSDALRAKYGHAYC